MVRSSIGTVEIVVDGDTNESLLFAAAGERKIRGTLKFNRIPSVQGGILQRQWGCQEIPGQRVGCDARRKLGWIAEPLQEKRHHDLRDRLAEKFECGFAPEREEFELADDDRLSTWLFWMQRAVEAGHARIVEGTFPDELPGTPRKHFFRQHKSSEEKLLEGILGMMEKQGELLSALAKKV